MIIGIPVYQGVDLLDVTGPHEVLGWMDPKPDIRLISKQKGETITTRDGFSFLSSHSFDETPHVDVLWVPGGDPDALRPLMHGQPTREYLDFLIDRANQPDCKWVCSVCEGALLLAAAGLLKGFKATTHWYFVPCLKTFDGVTVVDGLPRFVQDGNRLTGGGISSGLDESLQLIRLLQGDDAAHQVQRSIQYYPEPPFPNDLKVPSGCEFPGLTQQSLAG